MLKATEQNDKLKRAIILSIALHCVLIAVLIWSSIHQPQESSAGGGGSSIDAVMVDPGAVVQQYNRQQQQTDAQWAQQQRDKQAQQQAEELQQKQAAEQQRLKALEKQRLAAQEAAAAKQQAEAQAKQAAAEAKKQAEAKKAAAADAKADQAAKDKAAAAQAAKQSSDVDALLGGLTEAKNAPKAGGAPAGAGKAKLSGASGAEVDAYKAQIQAAIQNKLYDYNNYSGKTCDIRFKLAPDGFLISVNALGGDPALCQAAISAAKLANIPRPPSKQVYEAAKEGVITFKPD
ncbi:cell envelope integrity inner membrane protein TolA [Candidatus Sodalis pierantonius str. SOPE]|uniref:Cell envelope integrity inner membrane protein TolA n=1 Tax=Candidatus Sodalis pierantonii str. SOPE TaxID=2342 RepID=W0HLZ8_9GAMM|nr:cell envelope integrity protein TolA [Candidatus Sodalis pierantonius]AHF73215.1 cell envelope integrity inner membrane protein TolA [Candidatus Sodalis pierantonius str. SOPE]